MRRSRIASSMAGNTALERRFTGAPRSVCPVVRGLQSECFMQNQTHTARLVIAGAACSAICAGAGILAFTGPAALKGASIILVAALVVGGVGYAYADNRRLGWGILAIIAATLPLFGALYAIGEVIMRHLGPTVAGGALIGLSVAVAASTIVLSRSSHRLGAVAHGATRRV
jgi:hypothetical protein